MTVNSCCVHTVNHGELKNIVETLARPVFAQYVCEQHTYIYVRSFVCSPRQQLLCTHSQPRSLTCSMRERASGAFFEFALMCAAAFSSFTNRTNHQSIPVTGGNRCHSNNEPSFYTFTKVSLMHSDASLHHSLHSDASPLYLLRYFAHPGHRALPNWIKTAVRIWQLQQSVRHLHKAPSHKSKPFDLLQSIAQRQLRHPDFDNEDTVIANLEEDKCMHQ